MRPPERITPENKVITSDDIGLSEYDNLCKNFLNTEKTIWIVTNIYYVLLISIAGFIIKTFDELDWVLFLIIPVALIIIIAIFHIIFKRLGHVNILQNERIRELEKKVGQTLYRTVCKRRLKMVPEGGRKVYHFGE